MKRLIAVCSCVALASSLLLSGCGGSGGDSSSSAGGDNGELVLYTWEAMFPQDVLDGFEDETGVKVI